ncbi:MAG: hypothetical protein ACXWQO_13590 [Bdellovibrionota bacterium]
MKNLTTSLIALLIFASPMAYAANGKPGVSLPATAKLLFQSQGFTMGASGSDNSAIQLATDQARNNIQNRIDQGDDTHEPINVEYQCQGVYRVWSPADVREGHYGSNNGFFSTSGTGAAYYNATVTANVYCDPRDFRQKVAISAMQACEKEPKVECMSKEYMDAFSKIEKTTYLDIYRK